MAVVAADYLVVTLTTSVVVPLVGVLLFNVGGATTTINAQITFWLAPFLLVILLVAAGDLLAMRSLWRLGTRIIERTAAHRDSSTNAPASPAA